MNRMLTTKRWKTRLSQALIGTITIHASMVGAIIAAPEAQAAEIERVLINEVNPSGSEFVELYNAGSEAVDLNGWHIDSNSNSETITGDLGPGKRMVVDPGNLNRHEDQIWLKNKAGQVMDQVSYGNNPVAKVPAPGYDESIARVSDGSDIWVSGAPRTEGFSNSVPQPASITQLYVKGSSDNPSNVINDETKRNVVAQSDFTGEADGISVWIWDTRGNSEDASTSIGSGNSAQTELNTLGLDDGSIVLRGYSSRNGVMSAWVLGTPTSKDTIAPNEPLVTDPEDKVTTDQSEYTVTGTAEAKSKVVAYRDETKIAEAQVNSPFSLSIPLELGSNMIELAAIDNAWNKSDMVELPTITAVLGTLPENPADPTDVTDLNDGRQIVDLVKNDQIWLATGNQTVGDGDLTITNYENNSPTNTHLNGLIPVGNYYDVTTTNDTIFPLEIKIFYTNADLADAGIVDESQLVKVYYYDGSDNSWEPFEDSSVDTANLTVDGVNFAGYFSVRTNHLTPMVAVADVKAPEKPANFKAEAGAGLVKLTWDEVSDAAGYMVRYRMATNIDTIPYQTTYISDKATTELTINNLENGILYEFGITAQDAAGNSSIYAVVEQTPTAAGPTSDFITPATAKTSAGGIGGEVNPTLDTSPSSDNQQVAATNSNLSNEDETSVDDEQPDGDIKGGQDTEEETESNRSLVTILIIVIAAAAGFGGYYGYQWWTAKPEDLGAEETPPETKPAKESKRSSKKERTGRW